MSIIKDFSFRSLSFIKTTMIILNYFIVVFYGSIILLGTKYIVENEMSREFLNKITHIPRNPVHVFFLSIFLFGLLVFILYHRSEKIIQNKKMNMIYSMIEVLICFFVIYFLYMGYSGVLLLVFCDCIYHLKGSKYLKWVLVILMAIYFASHYDIVSIFIKLPNPLQYFEVFNASVKGILMISKNFLETTNIILFIAFMTVFLGNQIQEKENIVKELNMINQVNKELKNYAAVTEKIGENNERKRLAREIHDTLGHALTGIAAGIDACIAMIDNNPKATKQQLQVVSKVVRQGIGDVRNSLNKLRPGALEEKGLKGAIEKMIQEFSSVSDLTIYFDYQLDRVDFENTKEDILFRIIQESITNALRHGGATHIDILFYIEYQTLILTIKDNGVGCSEIYYGFGLKQMQERVAIINGTIEYDGTEGFLTVVKIPIQRGENYD